MCRNIVPLNNLKPPATDTECHDAALQFVRKIAASTRVLLDSLVSPAPPKDREAEAAKRKARSAERYEAIRVYQQAKRSQKASPPA